MAIIKKSTNNKCQRECGEKGILLLCWWKCKLIKPLNGYSIQPLNSIAAATAAKSFQSCPILCDPIDGSPPGSPVPGILQARALEWVAISFSNTCKWKVKVKSLSRIRLLATPWTAAFQAPPSIGFSRQEYWSGVPLPYYRTTALISHASKVMLKILQARLQQYVNRELPDVQLVLEKAEEPEIKLPTSAGSWKKQESSGKTSTSALLTMPKPLTVWITRNYGKFWKRWEYQTTWPALISQFSFSDGI